MSRKIQLFLIVSHQYRETADVEHIPQTGAVDYRSLAADRVSVCWFDASTPAEQLQRKLNEATTWTRLLMTWVDSEQAADLLNGGPLDVLEPVLVHEVEIHDGRAKSVRRRCRCLNCLQAGARAS